jgi:hypothetical protein
LKTGCVNHPTNEPLIVIRKWQVEVCDGNQCAAALISFFEYWHNIKLEMSEKNKKYNSVSEMHGDEGTQDTTLFQFHSEKDLEDGILIYSREAISKSIKILEEKGFLSVHKNPNPKYKFDRTRYFMFYPGKLNYWLSNIRSSENRQTTSENSSLSSENRSAITEITSETTSETSPKSKKKNIKKKKILTLIPDDFSISEKVKEWAEEKGHKNLEKHLEFFINKAIAKGYEYANWDAAFKEAISANWAKLEDSKNKVDEDSIFAKYKRQLARENA